MSLCSFDFHFLVDQELEVDIAGSIELFQKDELIEKGAALDIDPLMELVMEECDQEEEVVTAAEGAVESALAASKDLVPEEELDNPFVATETMEKGICLSRFKGLHTLYVSNQTEIS